MRFKRITGAIALERHNYAPEMNKLRVLDTKLSVAGASTFKEAYEQLGWTPSKFRIMARIAKVYPGEWKHLNQVWGGVVDKRSTALTLKRQMYQRESAVNRTLFDGRELPRPIITLRTWTVGG